MQMYAAIADFDNNLM